MTIISPSGREYEWGKQTPPSGEDFAKLKAYDESLDAQPTEAQPPLAQPPEAQSSSTEVPQKTNQPDLSAGQIAGGIGLEAGLTIAGGALGTLAGPVGTAAGAAIGGALGNYLNQKLIQDKETVSSGQVLASGAMSALPAGLFAKSVKAATSVGKVAAIRAGQGAGVGLGATVVEKAIDENRLPTAMEAGLAVGGGALFGGAFGGAEKQYALKGGLIANNFIAQGVQGTTALGVGAYAYNSAVERGDENPIPKAFAYAALTYGGTHVPSALAKMSKGDVLRKVAGPEAVLGKAMGPLRDAENAFKAMESDALAAGKVIKDMAMKEPNPNQVIADLMAVMDGKQGIAALSSAQNKLKSATSGEAVKPPQKSFEWDELLSVFLPTKTEGQIVPTSSFANPSGKFVAKMFQGRGATREGVYGEERVKRGTAFPVVGPANYYAFTEKDAQLYGNVLVHNVELENPLVIENVLQFRKLLGAADALRIDPLGREAFLGVASDYLPATIRVKNYVQSQGHDGIVVKVGDPNGPLAKMFAHDQVVAYGKVPKTQASKTPLFNFEESISRLPKSVREAYESFEAKRAKATDDILTLYESILEPDTVAAIKGGRTSYIRTTYAAHDPRAKVGVDYATAASSAKFKAELMGNGATDEEASATMNKMLKNVTDIYSPESFTKGTGPGSALKEKGNLSQAAREFLGEVKDPFARVENTLLAQNRLIINEERDVAIRSILTESGIAKKTLTPEEIASGTFVKMVKGDEPTVHRSLSDLYVPNYVADAFREAISPNLIGDGAIAKSWMTLSGLSKMSKTVGNLAEAISPQVFGNLAMAASGMKLNPFEIVKGIRMTMRSYGWSGKGLSVTARLKMNEELNEGRKYGILRGGVDSNELNTLISQSADIARKPKSVLEFMSKAYGFPDSAVRYSIWKGNIKELTKINWLATQPSGTGLDALKKHAAQITNDQFPTYELIPRRFRQASALGVANTFGAFEYEVIRNSSNQLKYAVQLINEGQKTGNYEMRAAGAKRLLAFSAVAGSTVGLSVAISRSNGIDAQRQQDLTNIMPSHSSNRANAFKMGKDGTFSYTPLNYLMPHANMTTAIIAGLQGGDSGAIIKSMMLGDDLGPFITPAVEGITNTYYGTKESLNEPRNNPAAAERFAIKAFMPQFISGTLTRMYKAKMGETNKLGNSPTGEDVMLRLAGYRQNTQLSVRSAAVRIRGISDAIADESSGYRRILKSSQETGRPIDEQTIYAERAERYEQKQKELRTIFSSLSRLSKDNGFSEGDIIDAFKGAGVPSRLIAGAVFGFITPMNRGLQQSNADIIREIMADPEASRNIKQSIIARAGGDRLVQKDLTDAYISENKSRARGVDPIASIFLGLSVGDNERANAIMRAAASMKDSPESVKKMMDHFKRTKVITPEVAVQIRGAKP